MAHQQQQALVVDLIEAVKRKRNRSRDRHFEGDSVEALYTNRGNKLKRNARYVQHGRLDVPFGVSTYRQPLEYNGFKRSIISRNPPLFDVDGDLVHDEDDLDDSVASPYDENVYKNVCLEDILQPLVAAADLPNHSSLSQPYFDRGLPEMIRNTEDLLHREQQMLWRMKELFTQLRGDSAWLPVGDFQDEYDDWTLGNTKPAIDSVPASSAVQDYATDSISVRGPESHSEKGKAVLSSGKLRHRNGSPLMINPSQRSASQKDGEVSESSSLKSVKVVNMAVRRMEDGNYAVSLPEDGPQADGQMDRKGSGATATSSGRAVEERAADQDAMVASTDDVDEDPGQLKPHRMKTRKQTRTTSRPSSRSLSPEPSADNVHPLFRFPAATTPDSSLGLPLALADESRAFLHQYVSKQEEVVRQLRRLLHGLLQGRRMRQDVLKWCKAEAHIGELSDGEDWYDKEEWGLEADLVKGKEEEEDEGATGKKTRRAARERN